MKITKADFHNHLQTCKPTCSFNEVVDIVSKKLGDDGVIGVVNVGDDNRYEKFLGFKGYERKEIGAGFYVPEKSVFVVKGQEVQTKQGHLLILGIEKDKHLKNYNTIEDAIAEARDLGGVIIASHPFFLQGIGFYLQEHLSLLTLIDAIEVHNGEAVFGNKKTQEFYKFMKEDFPHLGAISTSDGHSLAETGSSYTLIYGLNMNGLTESLRYAIRNNLDYEMNTSYLSAFNHMLDSACITALRKARLDKFAERLLGKEF